MKGDPGLVRRQFLALLLARGGIRLGIRTVVFQAHPMAEAARRIRQAGFEGVHLGLRFTDRRYDASAPDPDYADRARDTFGQAGLKIAGLDGYVNLVHPDPAVRRKNVTALAGMLEDASRFGTNIVATESGSFHAQDRSNPMPDNLEEEWRMFLGTMKQLVKVAEAAGTVLALEPSFATFISTTDMVKRLLGEIESPYLQILWDGAHLINASDLASTGAALETMAKTFGSKVVLAHANDVRLGEAGKTESCRAGTGKLDYRAYIGQLRGLGREVFLCLEHVKEPEVADSVTFLRRHL